ncbi:N-acetyltransferase family protein [Actinospongicola halichondriae]|uniref:GNAT family N-acetyltransferase n=1 Tax=Actinospongicola halichondriae TaxID=3236844 RepID=UPI003D3B4F65
MTIVRPATAADLPSIVDIYNVSVTTTATWSETPQTLAEREAWFAIRTAAGNGVFVAEDGGDVVGFSAYGEFRNPHWTGYRYTVENTVHVAAGHEGKGVGRALMEALIAHAVDAGMHVMVAAVDAENEGSVTFHETLGFEVVGRMPEIGRKFDRWLDLVLLQRRLS